MTVQQYCLISHDYLMCFLNLVIFWLKFNVNISYHAIYIIASINQVTIVMKCRKVGWKKEPKSWYMFDIIPWVINQKKQKSQSYKASLIYCFTIIYVSSDILTFVKLDFLIYLKTLNINNYERYTLFHWITSWTEWFIVYSNYFW